MELPIWTFLFMATSQEGVSPCAVKDHQYIFFNHNKWPFFICKMGMIMSVTHNPPEECRIKYHLIN